MADLQVQGVVHWSIPVNNLEESEKFYGEILGLQSKGRLGGSKMSCFKAGSHDILLCERKEPLTRTPQQDNRLHHAFMVSPDMWERGAKLLHERASESPKQWSIVRRATSPGVNCTFSIRAATCSNFAIRPGSRACRHRPTKRSSACN